MDRRLLGVLGLGLLASLAVSFLMPLIALPLSVALIIGGMFIYRHSQAVPMRSIAIASMVGGAVLLVLIILIGAYIVFTLQVRTDIIRYDGVPISPYPLPTPP